MIDTIHLSIDARKYRSAYWQIVKNWETKKMLGNTKGFLDHNHVMVRGKEFDLIRGSIKLPSSHYNISFAYYKQRETIEINVSIPKYLYGTNLHQFIISPQDQNWSAGAYNIEFQKKELWSKFYNWLKQFNREIMYEKISIDDYRIKRIDFCYNLIFKNVVELEHYYERLKMIKMKYLRENSEKHYSYMSSLFYVGKGWSFKIYKKGVEFRKNDLLKLEKFNDIHSKSNVNKFKIDKLTNIADRILRYEMTMQNVYMSRVYRNELFRKNDPTWQTYKNKYYQGTEGDKRKISFEAKKIYLQALHKAVNFYMEVPDYVKKSNNVYDENLYTDAKFSGIFFDLLLEKFWKKVNEYKLDSISAVEDKIVSMVKKDKLMFERIKKKTKELPLDELRERGFISLATFYRYKQFMKRFGINGTFVNYQFYIDWSYNTYFQYFINNGLFVKR